MKDNVILCIVLSLLACSILVAQVYVTGHEYISENAMSQRALFRYLQRQRHQDFNRALTSGQINPTGTEIQIKQNVHYLVDGYFKMFTATDTPGLTDTVQASGTRRIYVLTLDVDGVAAVTAGTAVTPPATPQVPAIAEGKIPFAYLNVLANDEFTLGTTDFNQTTTTANNISRLNPLGLENFQDL